MTVQKGTVEQIADRLMPACMRPFWERLRASRIGYRLAHGAFWSTMGAGMSQVLMLITSIIAARILGREQFGQYGMISSTVGMFSVVAGFGLGTTATKYVAQYKRTDPAKAGRIIALSSLVAMCTGAVSAGVLLAIAPWLSAKTLAAPHLSSMLMLATGIVFFGAVNSSQIGTLAGFEAFRGIARVNLINGILTFICVTGSVLQWGLAGAVSGQVLALCISCVVTMFAVQYEAKRFGVPLRYAGCWGERSVLVTFSFPAVLAGIMVSPVNWVCAAILVNQPNGYAEMGIFSAANSWQKAILFLPGSIGAIALPMLSDLHGANEREEYRKALGYNIFLNGASALIVAIIVISLSKIIMGSYGSDFLAGKTVLILLSFSSIAISIGSVVGASIISKNRIWYGLLFNMMWGIIFISLAYMMVPPHGAIGLAAANLLAYLVHLLVQLAYLAKSERSMG